MSVRVAPLFAGLAAGAALWIAAPACSDIDQALVDYCRRNEATAPERLETSCTTQADCCPGWRCSGGTCGRATVVDSGQDSGTAADSGTIEDAGSDAGQEADAGHEDGGTDVDAGNPACVELENFCGLFEDCCVGATHCAPHSSGVPRCVSSTCRQDDSGCSENTDCCSGQCLGDAGTYLCAPTSLCSFTGDPCNTDDDCCGAAYCDVTGIQPVCVLPQQGSVPSGNACASDGECQSGQCIAGECAKDAETCLLESGSCLDVNDCCGGLRCDLTNRFCVTPAIVTSRSCTRTGSICLLEGECCNGTCPVDGGVCS